MIKNILTSATTSFLVFLVLFHPWIVAAISYLLIGFYFVYGVIRVNRAHNLTTDAAEYLPAAFFMLIWPVTMWFMVTDSEIQEFYLEDLKNLCVNKYFQLRSPITFDQYEKEND